MLKQQELLASLRQKKILPAYLLYGDEEFLLQEAVDLLTSKVVDPESRVFNGNVVYCRDPPVSDIVNLAQTLPFMSAKRLVIAKDLDALKAAELEELIAYLKDPSPSTCLVLISNQGKYEKKSVITAVESHGAVTRFYALLDRELVAWIESWARARGLSLQRDAASYLWQTIGNDLQKIGNELQKVEIFIKERKTITLDDVKTVTGDFREYTSFDLADAIGRKNQQEAFLILSRLIQEGEQPVGLLGSVSWNFRRLTQAKSLELEGLTPDDSMKKLRPPVIFHQAQKFKEQMKRFSLDELRGVFEDLLKTDQALKSSGLGGRLALERMILKLCGTEER